MFFTAPDGTRLAYEDYGRGGPIVFVTSAMLNTDMWEYQIPFFAGNGFRCVTFDRRGHGRSERPSGGYDMDTLPDDLGALLDHLDLRDVVLVGHSTGGAEIARDRPRWLSMQTQPFFATHLGNDVSPAVIDWMIRMCLDASAWAVAETQRAAFDTDSRAALRAVAVPALVIHGSADFSAPAEVTAGVPPSSSPAPGTGSTPPPGMACSSATRTGSTPTSWSSPRGDCGGGHAQSWPSRRCSASSRVPP